MLAIYKKELRSFFHSVLGWFFIAINLFFAGWYFRVYGMEQGLPYLSYVLSGILMIILFSMPILSMKVFAEETKLRTDQLLYTTSLSVWKIILGKYFALVTIYFVVIAGISIYPLILSLFGDVPLAENYLALVGFFLFGMACLAIGVLISSLTDNQIIAAVLTFFVLFFSVMIPGICDMIAPAGNLFTRILKIFDLTAYMDETLYGKLYLPSFLYYFSVIFLCLYVTGFLIQKKHWRIATHGIGKAFWDSGRFVLVIAAVVLVNVAVTFLPKEHLLVDVTYNHIYSLSEEAKDILDQLEEEVTLYVLAEENSGDDTLNASLTGMAEYSPYITVVYVSPTKNPYFYSDYTDAVPSAGSVIVASEALSRVVDYYECYQVEYNYEYSYESGRYEILDYEVTGYDGEGQLLSAITYVATRDVPKIYCITGHDEIPVENELASLLEKANYSIETINLLSYEEIPEDADCIFLLGPLVDYSAEETEKISEYLKNGGNAMVVLAFTDAEELENYHSILAPYGIRVLPGFVMEQGSSYYNSYEYYLLPDILPTDITEGIYSSFRNKYVYMPYAKGMVTEENYGDVRIEPFLQTTQGAYIMDEYSGEEAVNAPYYLGIYAQKTYENHASQIVVFSSDYFLYEDVNMVVNGNNYTLFMNGLNKIFGNTQSSVVPVKLYSYDPIMMDETAVWLFSAVLTILIPGIFVVLGIVVWWKRRKA